MIQLVVPGTTFAHQIVTEPDPSFEVLRPTLVALIADALVPIFPYPSKEAPDPAELASLIRSGPVPSILRHPDFSEIRIRRLGQDGAESVMQVNLAGAIGSCRDDTPPEDARKSDFALEPGDIVELPLDLKGEPYRGFTSEQARYFHKVLSASVQVFRSEAAPFLASIDWQPAQWIETSSGLLSFSPEQGMTTTRSIDPQWLKTLGYPGILSVERNGRRASNLESRLPFLRDGDRLYLGFASGPSSQPRPKVIPPGSVR